MECEICGKKIQRIFISEIEGVVLRLCEECSKSGNVLNVVNEEVRKLAIRKNDVEKEEYELIENYGSVIKEARIKLGLSIEELAERIKEKSSLIMKVEKEEIRPSDDLVDKLERVLKVKLREKVEGVGERIERGWREMKLRIADVVEIKD